LGGADVFFYRSVEGGWVPLALACAIGLWASRAGLAIAAVLCVLWLAIWVGVLRDDSFQRDDWQGAAKTLGAPQGVRALVINPGYARAPLARYGQSASQATTRPIRVRDMVVVGVYSARVAPPTLDGFRLVGRQQIQHIGIARYHSTRPRNLEQTEFAPPGSPASTPRRYVQSATR
jgi:hypothetical protein